MRCWTRPNNKEIESIFSENNRLSKPHFDWPLLVTSYLLALYGVLAITIANFNPSLGSDRSLQDLIMDANNGRLQLMWVVVSMVVVAIIMSINYNIIGRLWPVIYFVDVLLLGLVLTTSKINGVSGWFQFLDRTFQPSELVKICFVLAGASTMDRIVTRRNLALFIAYSGIICGCLVLMNDFGTALIFFAAFLVIAYLRSGNFATIALVCAATGFGGIMALRFLKPHVLSRFASWRHVWEVPLEGGYQQTRAMMCIASGGLLGLGGGNGWLKYVAASDTDLVFATVSEEWGLLIGVMMVLAVVCLGAFVVRAAPVGRSSFYTIGACAAISILMVQTILNVLGTVDLLPLTGVTFPFVSNGGSSMISAWGMLAFIKAADTRQNASFAIRLPSRKKEAVQYE